MSADCNQHRRLCCTFAVRCVYSVSTVVCLLCVYSCGRSHVATPVSCVHQLDRIDVYRAVHIHLAVCVCATTATGALRTR